jgi:hypothetical protein
MQQLFILTSAINTDFGSRELLRFNSTLNTINSILVKYPDADIWLNDTGKSPISRKWKKHLPKNVRVIDYSKNDEVSQILLQSDPFRQMCELKYKPAPSDGRSVEDFAKYLQAGYVKNRTEIKFFRKTLDNNLNKIMKYDRVFKLSGRYTLSPTHDMSNHYKTGKIVTYNPIKSIQRTIAEDHPELKSLIPCFLWSFDAKMVETVSEMLGKIDAWLTLRLNKAKLADIEHGLELARVSGGYGEHFEFIDELGVFTNVNEKSQIYI